MNIEVSFKVIQSTCSSCFKASQALCFELDRTLVLVHWIFFSNADADEEWIHSSQENGIGDQDAREIELLRYRPPDEGTLSALRETRVRQKEIKRKFINLGDYLFILLVLVLVSYGNRDPASFTMRNSLEQEFMHPLTASFPQGLDDVS